MIKHCTLSLALLFAAAILAWTADNTPSAPGVDGDPTAPAEAAKEAGPASAEGGTDGDDPLDAAGPTEAPEPTDEVESVVEEWRRTLRYGIDSEVLELLPQLREGRRQEPAAEVLEVMEISLNTEVRVEALKYFTELSLPDAVPIVTEILATDDLDQPVDIVQHALWYIERVVDEPSARLLEAVRGLVEHRDSRIASTAVRTLGDVGTQVDAGLLMDLYRAPRTPMDVQQSALLALGALGNPEAEELLLSIAGDAGSESTSRYYAIDALSKIGSEEATDLFQELLGSDDAILRSYAVAALARYDDPAVARTLELALRDSFWRVRVSALEGIAERGAAQALEAVMYKVERDPEMRVRYEAVKTVAAIGTEEAWRFLRELYVDQRTPVTVRNSIAEQLIEGNLDESREAIATVLEQEWDRPGSTLLDYIGKKLSQTRAESLDGLYEKLLAHPNFIIRIYGIRGIGLNGHNEFRDTLQHLAQAEDAHRAIRSNARAALDALGSPVGPSAHDAAGETVSGEGAD